MLEGSQFYLVLAPRNQILQTVEELIGNRAQPHEEGMKQSKDKRRDYSMNAQHEFNTNSHMHLRQKL
jgi:hypothetical protein